MAGVELENCHGVELENCHGVELENNCGGFGGAKTVLHTARCGPHGHQRRLYFCHQQSALARLFLSALRFCGPFECGFL